MKIMTQKDTYEDFVKNEVREYGLDYVEAQFVMGYEPALVNSVWLWVMPRKNNDGNDPFRLTNGDSYRSGGTVRVSNSRVFD